MDISVTYKTTPNIAIVKYWGKRDKVLNLPVNSSLSLTLRDYGLHTITTVRISDQLKSDQLVFNGVEHSLLDDKKIFNVVKRFRDIVRNGTNPRLADYHICVNTQNSFPTAAGMASSASGLACLTKCLSTVYGVLCSQEDEPLLNSITRQASGSACRSLYGGLVHWYKGLRADGLDSIARQIYPSDYWPELRIGICIVSENVKSIGSTEGMNRCVDTSPKMRIRFTDVVDDQIAKAIHAFSVRDFASLGEIIMKESDTLHEICAEAQPPIHYLSKQSHFIIDLVKAINVFMKRIIVTRKRSDDL